MPEVCTNCNKTPEQSTGMDGARLVDVRVVIGEDSPRRADVTIFLCGRCLPIYLNTFTKRGIVSHRHDHNYLEDPECPVHYRGGQCPTPFVSGQEIGYYQRQLAPLA